MYFLFRLGLFLPAALLVASCSTSPVKRVLWKSQIGNIGTYSSPRTADLNRDGILDIVIGAGGQENKACNTAVLAINGITGELLWKVNAVNQIVGSAVFYDITGDKIPDVFIGGRWAELFAIDGATGNKIWSFLSDRKMPDPRSMGWFNFTTPQFVTDQDGDGMDDLLIANGGDPMATANDTKRPAGRILLLSSKSGKILANARVPDGREIYMSVVCLKSGANLDVFFGTGGETIGGNFYRTTLKDIVNNDISNAKILASSKNKGFIGSPVLADVTLDGTLDIVLNTVDGRMLAINGANDELLWEVILPGTEGYSTPAVGYFNEDNIPDFYANFGIGAFPSLHKSQLVLVDGKSGNLLNSMEVSQYQYASPIAADLNNDGWDEIIINKNEIQWVGDKGNYISYLMAIDFKNDTKYIVADTLRGSNEASTPWIGDLDNDKYLDIVYTGVSYPSAELIDPKEEEKKEFIPVLPKELILCRYATGVKYKKAVIWGGYMGSRFNGIFKSAP